jgi:Kef-type K+ transport system membrane component KefB
MLVFLLQIALLLSVALCFGRVAGAIGLPSVVGELIAGVVLGPSVLGHLWPHASRWLFPVRGESAHLLDALAQVGVLLLVGITGAHLDLTLSRRLKVAAVRAGTLGLLIPLGLGVALGWLLPASLATSSGTHRTTFAVFLGVALCVTAVPVIAKTLIDMRLLHRDIGQLSLAAAMIDDAAGWLLLSVVSAMAANSSAARNILISTVSLIAFIAGAVLIGRPAVRWLFLLPNRLPDAGPSVAMAAIVIFAGAALTQELKLEAVFGAFVGGILIAQPGAAQPDRLAGLRTVTLSVLAPIFLASAGLRIDLTLLGKPVVAACAALTLAVAIVSKFVGAYLGARWSRLSRVEGVALGAAMNCRGAVEIVVASIGLRLGVITTSMYTIIVLVAIVTSMMAPPLLRLATARISHNAEEELRESAQARWLAGATAQPSR